MDDLALATWCYNVCGLRGVQASNTALPFLRLSRREGVAAPDEESSLWRMLLI